MKVTIKNVEYTANLIETTTISESEIVERWKLFAEDEYVGRLCRWNTGAYVIIFNPGILYLLNPIEIEKLC